MELVQTSEPVTDGIDGDWSSRYFIEPPDESPPPDPSEQSDACSIRRTFAALIRQNPNTPQFPNRQPQLLELRDASLSGQLSANCAFSKILLA
jgi:hypothetical protein